MASDKSFTHIQVADEIRQLADFVANHPELPVPNFVHCWSPSTSAKILQNAGYPVSIERHSSNWVTCNVRIGSVVVAKYDVLLASLIQKPRTITEYEYSLPDVESDGGAE